MHPSTTEAPRAAPAETPAPGTSRGYPARRIYSVVGVPPEIQAYALAKYSRSSQGMLESIAELSAQRAEQFLTTFYFQYGVFTVATYCMYGRNRAIRRKGPVHLPQPVPLARACASHRCQGGHR